VLGRLFGGCWVSFGGDDKVMIRGVRFMCIRVLYSMSVRYSDAVLLLEAEAHSR